MIKYLFKIVISLNIASTIAFCSFYDDSSVVGTSLGRTLYPYNLSGAISNPASLFCVDNSQVLGSYYILFDSARYNLIGYVQKESTFAIGIQAMQFYRDGIEVRTTYTLSPDSYTNSSQLGVITTYSQLLPSLFQIDFFKDMILGVNIKFLSSYMAGTQSILGIGGDIGIFKDNIIIFGTTLSNKFSLDGGISISNIVSPNLQNETYPSNIKISLIPHYTLFPTYQIESSTLSYDEISGYIDIDNTPIWNIGAGLQYRFLNLLYLRGGYRFDDLTFGFGIKFENININYSFVPKDYGTLHFIDVVYTFGNVKRDKVDAFEDVNNLVKKAERIYERACRYSEELFANKDYDNAIKIITPSISLVPSNNKASDLLALFLQGKLDELNNAKYALYTKEAEPSKAYQIIIDTADQDTTGNTAKLMFEDFKGKQLTDFQKLEINTTKYQYLLKINKNVESMISIDDFKTASKELRKLETIDPESDNTSKYQKEVEKAKSDYIDKILNKAISYLQEKNYKNAYIFINEVSKLSPDNNILLQKAAIKTAYKNSIKQGTEQDLYQKKLYLLTAIKYAEGGTNKEIKDMFWTLKIANAAYEYIDILEEQLINANIIDRFNYIEGGGK